MIDIQPPQTGLGAVCEPLLRALPDWFGIEEANQHYITYIDAQPTYLARVDGRAAGFLTLKQHYPQSAEIYVMGVHPDYHRQGIGRALVTAAEADLKEQGVLFLQVKTLGEAHPDADYRLTRQFYRALGFIPLEEFPDLWPGNPALLLVKYLGK